MPCICDHQENKFFVRYDHLAAWPLLFSLWPVLHIPHHVLLPKDIGHVCITVYLATKSKSCIINIYIYIYIYIYICDWI